MAAGRDDSGGERASGILPVQAIRALVEAGHIGLAEPLAANQLQPASLDLRLGASAWRVRASFLPGSASPVAGKLRELALHEIRLGEGAVLETGCVYVAPLLESLALPEGVSAAANPKSSTGRLDVFTRVIADCVPAFDQVPCGYRGPLYAEICPQTFTIVVRRGSMLSQIRFRAGDPVETDDALAALHKKVTLVRGGAAADVRGGPTLRDRSPVLVPLPGPAGAADATMTVLRGGQREAGACGRAAAASIAARARRTSEGSPSDSRPAGGRAAR